MTPSSGTPPPAASSACSTAPTPTVASTAPSCRTRRGRPSRPSRSSRSTRCAAPGRWGPSGPSATASIRARSPSSAGRSDHLAGLHGLFLTWSSLQSGFDTDVLSAGFHDRTIEGPDTNAFMVLEYEALAELARLLGHPAEADGWLESAGTLRQRIEDLLWSERARPLRRAALGSTESGAPDAEIVGTRDVDGRGAALRQLDRAPPAVRRDSVARARTADGRGAAPAGGLLGPGRGPHLPRRRPLLPAVAAGAALRLQEGPPRPGLQLERPGVGALQRLSGRGARPVRLRRRGAGAGVQDGARSWPDDLARTGALHECWNDAGVGLWPRSGTFVSWNVLGPWLLDRLG